MMVGKDAQGKRIIDLSGSAKDPKDLFEFKGLLSKVLISRPSMMRGTGISK